MSDTMQAPDAVTDAMVLQYRVEQFLYHEAALLDGRQFEEWLTLFTPDISYWMPIRRIKTVEDLDQQFTARGDIALFDDEYDTLEKRVKKATGGFNWSEEPPSRTRYLITNVRIVAKDADTLEVHSNFHLHRSRQEDDMDDFIGHREDLLVTDGDSFRIKRRHIFLEQTVIQAANMAILF